MVCQSKLFFLWVKLYHNTQLYPSCYLQRMHCEWSLSVPASLTLPHSNLLNEWKQSNYNLLKNYKPGNKCIPSLHQYTSSPSFTTPWSFAYSTSPWNSSIAIPSENCFQFIPRHQLKELKDNNNAKQTINTDNTHKPDYNFGIRVIKVTILNNKKVTLSNKIIKKWLWWWWYDGNDDNDDESKLAP